MPAKQQIHTLGELGPEVTGGTLSLLLPLVQNYTTYCGEIIILATTVY